ncbi:MAG: hypothetical protein KBA26_08195 [Candidatus Delongbacteria bacterium]|nr:hypothetical protein [Candidatus Delongbacteria bacterium]
MFRFIGRSKYPRKIDINSQLNGFYGQHRSGWPYVLSLLKTLHCPGGILLDTFIERTFCWHPDGIKPNLRPWIGFIHVPPGIPKWFQYQQSNEFIFNSPAWKQSYPHCLGLFALSAYHQRDLQNRLDIPIERFYFPTEIPKITWNWERFKHNRDRKIIQIGWWLRKLHSIYRLPSPEYHKIFLRVTHADLDPLLARERTDLIAAGLFKDEWYHTAETLSYLPNKHYDRLLSENLVFLDLYDSSANNTVIECMVRHTPILINPLESVKEYLGQDYPLYFNDLGEAATKACDLDLIYRAHLYLKENPIQYRLSRRSFLDTITQSRIYQNL